MDRFARVLVGVLAAGLSAKGLCAAQPFTIVDTGQTRCFDNRGESAAPKPGQPFDGQDANYRGVQPSYKDNGDGTVTDLNTGLMWQKGFDLGRKQTFAEAKAGAARAKTGDHTDWRLPTIKELYSLMDFSGGMANQPPKPYLDTRYFEFIYGDPAKGEREIDAQYWSSTEYVGRTMRGNLTVFGVNFADGRIKGYPRDRGPRGRPAQQFVRYVRGNPAYGRNDFHDNGDGTVTDRATGLIWQKADSGKTFDWEKALAYAENLTLAGHDDWRLPNAKELQSIVDYTRAPDASDKAAQGPAIDPIFKIADPESYFWTGTTHLEGRPGRAGDQAVYICFGQAMGYMERPGASERQRMNVHGAGAQRSDPKSGDPEKFPYGRGPQGDDVRIYNYVRCVRGGEVVKQDAAALPSPRSPMREGALEGDRPPRGPGGEGPPPPPPEGGRGGGPGMGGSRPPDPPIITALDLNGDGIIGAGELAKASESLKKLDKTGEGELTPDELRPPQQDRRREPAGGPPRGGGGYSIEQAISDRAQLHTIAFDALAFLTGDLGSSTFLPPGKVADFCGFQYMRDVDINRLGHNTSFVPRAANNVLYILTDEQKGQLVALAKEQEKLLTEFAHMRFPLIKAFCRQLSGGIPAGSTGLDREAVMKYTARFFEVDGLLSFQRAKVLGGMIRSLTDSQKTYLGKMVFNDSATWPELEDQVDKRSLSHDAHVAVMTYASEMFSWYAGSLEADVYFCPERHATYFGSFYMKDIPAMGNANFSISTSLTGDSGEAFLAALTESQRQRIVGLVDLQRKDLQEIVSVRRAIALELRRFMEQESVDKDKVLSLSRRYGELDGEISYLYATSFAEVGKTLTEEQKKALLRLRNLDSKYTCKGAYLYSRPIEMPEIRNTDFLFGAPVRSTPAVPSASDAPSTPGASFVLRSPAVADGGLLPKEYTGEGVGATLPLEWNSPPAGTRSYAVIMHHVDPEGKAKWYWTLYNIPANVQSLPENVQGVGTLGTNSIDGRTGYAPPHSRGPGAKTYIFTVYALSAPLELTVPPSGVTRDVLLASMKEKVLASSQLQVIYAREGAGAGQGTGRDSGAAARDGPPRDAARGDRPPRDAGGRAAEGQDPPPPPPPKGGRGDPGGPGGFDRRSRPMPIIVALDLNEDGVIDADEIAKAPESLKVLDRNGDGELTPDEYRHPPPGGPGGRPPGDGKDRPPPRDGE